ncbi:MAG: carboxypeptidase-like regulatory domain-containing protein [Desulfobacteraceae bacterium]|nr:carboxypeptidase-like regulatory domain-containing protein [Desulfobacteraceae bacterium]
MAAAPVVESEKSSPSKAGSAARLGTYVVRTIWQNTPLSGAHVEWRRQLVDSTPAYAAVSERIGTAIFRPATGAYFITAEWREDGNYNRPPKPGDRFAWFGGNPWWVTSANSEVITLLMEEVPPPATVAPPKGTGVCGVVTLEGAPVDGAGVFAYSKTGTGLKADDFQAMVRTNAKGEFAFDLPPDRYFLIVRLRADHSVSVGPMHKGDLLGYDPMNPVVVKQGRYTSAAIPMLRLRMEKTRSESAVVPLGSIEGRIADRAGHPVEGAYAALYLNPKMIGIPVFLSDPTGADGRFKMLVPVPGRYFVAARSGYGRPLAGSWFGAWGGSEDHALKIKLDEVRTGVDIAVDKLLKDAKSLDEQ